MDDTSFSGSFSDNSYDDDSFDDDFVDDALFDSVAYHGDGGDDEEDNDSVCDDNIFITSDDVLDDLGSFESDEDIEEQREKEDELPVQTHSHSRRSSSGRIFDAQPKRSEYAARRCKSVDFMTERLMIHADEYYRNSTRRTRRSKVLIYVSLVFGLLTVLVTTILVVTPIMQHIQQPQEPEKEASVVAETTKATVSNGNDSDLSSQGTNFDITNKKNDESPKPINVPFGNRHNLNFDGLLFVKTRASSQGNHRGSTIPVFDSYAKTLDAITELHFEPGESNTTKQIVLTTTQPNLVVQNRINQDLGDVLESDPGLVLSIGLESNGELWLPQTTGQKISNLNAETLRSTRHHSHQTVKKGIYGPGDRFVLTISEDAITLFRNDHRELIGMWKNPSPQGYSKNILSSSYTSSSELPALPLYAQIWFKDADSSMLATAWKDHQLAKTRDGIH